jgi:hypothetical protein
MDLNTREEVIDIVFEIIESTKIKNFADLKLSLMKNAKTILSSYNQIGTENKKMITATITAFVGIIKDNAIEEYKKDKTKGA